MKRNLILVVAAITAIAAIGCQETVSITGSVGERQVVGTILPSGDLSGADPTGIRVTVPGEGVEAIASSDGAFVLTGLTEGDLELRFFRAADGIDASLLIGPGVTRVTVELEKGKAQTRRRSTRAPRIQLEGLITSISPDSITLLDSSRKLEVTCAIDENTVIRKGYRQLTTDDLAIDDRVHVRAHPVDEGDLVADEIKLQEGEDDDEPKPTKMELEGTIVAIAPDSITVMDASTGEQTAAITDETVIRKGKDRLTVDDLTVGDRVHVKARVEDDESLTALEIKLQNSGG
jgi:hypothetical protein